MKKYIILLCFFSTFFLSCKKDPEPKPDTVQSTVQTNNTNPIGIAWELYSGRVFVENLDVTAFLYYDHFSSTKNASNLDIYAPSWLPIDIVTKGLTTWKFTSSNQFILDGGSTYSYNVNTNGIFNVYGLENGSARNIEVLLSTPDYINVKVYLSYGNDGINNYSFYSVLTFVRQGYTGTPAISSVPFGYSYAGVVNGSVIPPVDLTGTKWLVTKYIQSLVPAYPNDTLDFISATQYTINSSTPRTYSLSAIVGTNMKSLSLYSFTTLGGDWSGQLQETFVNDWVINNSQFIDLFSIAPNSSVWMLRLN